MAEGFASLSDDALRLVATPGRRLRVTIDGAAFDDLPLALGRAGLFHRPLYKGPDRAFMAAGPFLIDPYRQRIRRPAGDTAAGVPVATAGVPAVTDDPGEDVDPVPQMEKLLALVGLNPAAVFWVGGPEMTDASLYRQLRGLNKVLIPRGWGGDGTASGHRVSDESDAGLDAGRHPDGGDTHEAVLFRHADGNVLAKVLPVLDATQFARLFGPAEGVTFLAPKHPTASGSVLCREYAPADVPRPTAGMLRLSPAQMRGIEAARLEGTCRRIARHLRGAAPEHTRRLSDADLDQRVAGYFEEARGLNVRSEAELRRWCFLQVTTGGQIGRAPLVTDYMTSRRLAISPDERVRHVMRRMIELRLAAAAMR